ncbi:acyl-CoA dehydrogenase family protein [Actinomadura livida]|uniref:Acyl-CoA dehydrogenase family protein n=1 Tax=Actinomadura livida TaxID=79909 RepID=A0A7W7IF34_9ACTN|nr:MULTISPECIES: acyl-CoA dehydrogenase family protein [Actinomadura]MBB4775932.1 alkylation response protein AidB-like acyl-CoA dehydrogenase [Actinomadura catellatispora]GGU16668.1 acyl-CoA dehydrogenase [Actinomadura livida]
MRFSFSDDQTEYAAFLADLLGTVAGPGYLRAAWSAGHAYESTLWPKLAESGLFGVCVPEEEGGAGGTLVDLALCLEACGYHGVPEPVVETAVLAPHVIGEFGSEAERKKWLRAIAEGEAVASASFDPSGITPDGTRADVVVVKSGEELHLVTPDRASWQPLDGVDLSRRLARGTFAAGEATLLTADPAAAARASGLGAAATACVLVGVAQRLADMTREYVIERRQFGRALGTFQILKHRLANVAIQTEAARSLAWYACYAVAHRAADAPLAAARAKAAANRASELAGSAALQLHGGIGFTWEHDLHLWLQRGKALEGAFGSTLEHRTAVGGMVIEQLASPGAPVHGIEHAGTTR